jgi:hypothetical protein
VEEHVLGLCCYFKGIYEGWGRHVLSVIISIDLEECGVRILQVRVNLTCYYSMPKDWNPETCTRLQKCILKYSAGSGKFK